MRVFLRAVCTAVALAVLGGSLAACKAKETKSETVSADMPWYDSTTVMLDESFDRFEYDDIQTRVLGVSDNSIIAFIYASKRMPPGQWGTEIKTLLRYYDLEGNIKDEIDIYSQLEEDPAAGDIGMPYIDISNADIRGDKLYLNFYSLEASSDVSLCFDLKDKKVLSVEKTEDENFSFLTMEPYREFDGYRINMYTGREDYVFTIVSPDGTVKKPILSVECPEIKAIYGIKNYIYLGEGKLLANVTKTDFRTAKILIDLPGGSISSIIGNTTYDWLDEYADMNIIYSEKYGNILSDDYGISAINLEKQTVDRIMTYDECNINRADMDNMMIDFIDDKTIILSGSVIRGGQIVSGNYELYSSESVRSEMIILNKAESNPNAGKTILKAAYISGDLSYATSEAIRMFNEQSKDVIIVADSRYTTEALSEKIIFAPEDTDDVRERKANAAFISTLSVDLMTGNGPDIIFGTISCKQLDDPQLLLDLKGCINTEGCFMQIINSSMTGDALYQVPLCFSVDGILTRKEYDPASGVGFTFEEYDNLIKGPCNGKEPTGLNRVDLMNLCMKQMSDQFYVNGKYEFNNDAFRQLIEYTESYSTDKTDREVDLSSILTGSVPDVSYVSVCSARSMLMKVHGPLDNYSLLGIASVDGRGPLANVRDSVAVSASTSNSKACLEFVSMLTGQEYQQIYAHNTAFPVNCNAFIEEAYQAVREVNEHYEYFYSKYFTASEMIVSCVPAERLDEDAFVGAMYFYADSASGIGFVDSPVQIIVSEEVQAYFAGQKTPDEVIVIIDERVATYVKERET